MKLKLLRRTHADCDLETWRTYDDLCKGGPAFKKRIKTYLPRHEVEPEQAYKIRIALSHFLNYCGPIAQFFSSMLFSSPPVMTSDPETVDQDYADFKEDADGKGTDLEAFVQQCFDVALIKQKCYARLDVPQQPTEEERARLSLKDYEDAGLDAMRLVKLCPERIINWRKDDRGRFIWVVEYEKREELLNFGDEELTITETWTMWSDDDVKRWQIVYKKSEKPDSERDVPLVEPPEHIGRIPIVDLTLPDTLWLMSFIADAQLEHFRVSNALSWAEQRTCFPMLFMFLKDMKKPPVMGPSYYGILGFEDDARYVAPDSAAFGQLEARAASLKDEIHRVATQMARGVENNAAAVGRSGQSKLADNTATEVVLEAMAHHVCEFIEEIMDLVSYARNDDVNWSVTNPATFDLADANTLITNAVAAMPLGIASAEHQIQTQTAVSMAMNAHADETAKKKIRDEIRKGASQESVAMMQQAALGIPFPKPGEGGGKPAAGAKKPADANRGEPEPPATDQPLLK